MEENFVGHLLGALDPVTEARTEAYLKGNPEGRTRLALVQQALAPLDEDGDEIAAPPNLVVSTLAFIAEQTGGVIPQPALPNAPVPSRHQVGAPVWRWMRPVDWGVAAALFLLASGFAFPMLVRQWREQQRVACANNLRAFWVSLSAFGDRGEGEFPQVAESGPRGIAGIFVPILTDSGLATDLKVTCPATGKPEPFRYTVAELAQMAQDAPEEYRLVSRDLSGDYAYCLGYQNGTRLQGLRRDSGDGLPILADAATASVGNSPNHLGTGQNVLYVGGEVRWCTTPAVGLERDHIYINHRHRVQAGVCKIDTVLGASDARAAMEE